MDSYADIQNSWKNRPTGGKTDGMTNRQMDISTSAQTDGMKDR
jgi:hypothetical protein